MELLFQKMALGLFSTYFDKNILICLQILQELQNLQE